MQTFCSPRPACGERSDCLGDAKHRPARSGWGGLSTSSDSRIGALTRNSQSEFRPLPASGARWTRSESSQNILGPGLRPQHPPSDAPAISVRLAEPPSVVGIGGGQTDAAAPGAAAVVLGPWVEVSGISPGNSTGDCDDADAAPGA